MRWLALVVTLLVARPARTDACGVASPLPQAHVQRTGDYIGRQPWIAVANVGQALRVTRVTEADCGESEVCKGTPIAVVRSDRYVRPASLIAPGSRVQVTVGKEVLADFTVATTTDPLPAWNGVTFASSRLEPGTACYSAYVVITLALKPTKANLERAFVLAYFEKPDPKQPMVKLRDVVSVDTTNRTIAIGGGLATTPTQLWIMLADANGHVGPPIAVAVRPPPDPSPDP